MLKRHHPILNGMIKKFQRTEELHVTRPVLGADSAFLSARRGSRRWGTRRFAFGVCTHWIEIGVLFLARWRGFTFPREVVVGRLGQWIAALVMAISVRSAWREGVCEGGRGKGSLREQRDSFKAP